MEDSESIDGLVSDQLYKKVCADIESHYKTGDAQLRYVIKAFIKTHLAGEAAKATPEHHACYLQLLENLKQYDS